MVEFAPYYYTIYWSFVMLLTMNRFCEIQPQCGYSVLYQRDNYWPVIIFNVFFIVFFGFRPISVFFGDTVNYNASYQMMMTYGMTEVGLPAEMDSDWIFYHFMFLCAQVVDVYYFFAIIMFFYIVMMFVGCRDLDMRHGATLMLFCIGAFSFYGYAVNGIRNGVACSFVIMALAGICRGKRLWPLLFSFIAIGCHKSTALPLTCMFFTYFVRNPKYMYGIWLVSIAVSLVWGDTISNVISLLSFDERLTEVALKGDEVTELWGETLNNSFRWDFLLYSSMPVLLGAYTLFVRKIYNNTYLIMLGTYIYANAFWILVIRDVFSNRFAYLSWFLYPLVLAYPLFNLPVFEKNHSQKAAWIFFVHFGFTTIMWMLGK